MNDKNSVPPPKLQDFIGALGLPEGFCRRSSTTSSKTVGQVLKSYDAQVGARAFITGLFFSFVCVAEDLLTKLGVDHLDGILERHVPETVTSTGRRADTLVFDLDDAGIVRLRPYYNKVEDVVINRLRRYDYPRCAPHATRAWSQYQNELSTIVAMAPEERLALCEGLWKRIVELPEFAPRKGEEQTIRPFSFVLRSFPYGPGEPAGALLQGLAFAYFRADAPNVTLETGRSGAGGARTGRIGDVDGWSGESLVLAIEVKDIDLDSEHLGVFASFRANLREYPDATAITLARSFTDEAKMELSKEGLLVLDRASMLRNVELWDLRKQQLAMRELNYFMWRVQQNTKMLRRLHVFVSENRLTLE
jgi:hypothetical protein